jgi:hypothetical protein
MRHMENALKTRAKMYEEEDSQFIIHSIVPYILRVRAVFLFLSNENYPRESVHFISEQFLNNFCQ